MINKILTFISNKKNQYIISTQILSALVGFIFGKVIALHISPKDFGIYNLQFGIYTFFFTFLLSPIIQFYKSSITGLYKKVGFYFFGLNLLKSLVLFLVFLIGYLYFFSAESVGVLFMAFIFLFFAPLNILFNLQNDYNNVIDNYKKFSLSNVVKIILGLLVLVFFVLKETSLEGFFIIWVASLMGFLGATLVAYNKNAVKIISNHEISYRLFNKQQLQFAFPLIMMGAVGWVNNYLDRFIIKYFLNLEQVGIYNANYGLGAKFFLLLSPMFLVLLTPYIYGENNIENKKKQIKRYSITFFVLGLFVLTLIGLSYEMIGKLFLSESYKEGFYIIFLIALAHLFLIGTHIFETIFYAGKKTKIILYGGISSAIVNVILNIILVSKYGIKGAALSTVFSFLTQFLFIYFKYKKYENSNYRVSKV